MTLDRRQLLKKVVGVGVAGAAAIGASSQSGNAQSDRQRYGHLTVSGHSGHKRLTGETLHVFVDGFDVTKNCYEADDDAGYALVFCRDEQHHRDLTARGARHVSHERGLTVCSMRLTGDVRIVPGEPL